MQLNRPAAVCYVINTNQTTILSRKKDKMLTDVGWITVEALISL